MQTKKHAKYVEKKAEGLPEDSSYPNQQEGSTSKGKDVKPEGTPPTNALPATLSTKSALAKTANNKPPQTTGNANHPTSQRSGESKKLPPKTTKVTVKYNCGFGNSLFIRGQGANLSWDKGTMLRNINADEWVWETTSQFAYCEYKILLNDHEYEQGSNHPLVEGESVKLTPKFSSVCYV